MNVSIKYAQYVIQYLRKSLV